MSIFSTILTAAIGYSVRAWRLPAFTLPFNFTAVIFLLGCFQFSRFSMEDMKSSLPSPVVKEEFVWNLEILLTGMMMGLG